MSAIARVRQVAAFALAAVVIAYALLVIHNFYRYVDYAIYLATDDGLANISYAWASVGRYGFLSSPQLADVARTHGQFNYGPWYFGLGAALIWLFGYSLTLVRSIHLWVIVAIAALAPPWFRDGRHSPAWAVVALGGLLWFVGTQWPMARPDSIVSLFAVLTVMSTGRAIDRQSRIAWAAAGLCAACGAFSHLIAWSLVPAVLTMWALSEGISIAKHEGPVRVGPAAARLASLGAGLAAGTLVFYASFGFQIGTQLGFLMRYRQVTQAAMRNGGAATSFGSLVAAHFHAAFGQLRPSSQTGVIVALVLGWVIVLTCARWPERLRRTAMVYCMPPLVAWTFYSLSLGTYSNFHSGYKVLTQVLALWFLASLLFLILDAVWDRLPAVAPMVALAATGVLLYSGARTLRHAVKEADARLLRTNEWVSISTYLDEILGQLPGGATAWGTLTYGNENPDRVQLIQYGDAMQLIAGVTSGERSRLAPQFVLWGFPENAAGATDVLNGGQSWLEGLEGVFSGVRYRLVALVAAPPYGVTRIYQQVSETVAADGIPSVSLFDPTRHQWIRRPDRVDATSETSSAITFRLPWGGRTHQGRTSSARAVTLPAGDYLLVARLHPGARSKGGVVVASPHLDLDPEVTEFGATTDFTSYRSDDSAAMLMARHGGGPLHVGLIDSDEHSALTGIDAYRMSALRPPDANTPPFGPIAAWRSWESFGSLGVRVSETPDGLAVTGNDSRFGYQLMSPELRTPAGGRVLLRFQQRIDQGRVCVGVLNRTQQHWLVTPDQARTEYELFADDSGGIRVVFANCGPANGAVVPSRFVVSSADYAVVERRLYADELIDATRRTTERKSR
jgi:hypothetical protein